MTDFLENLITQYSLSPREYALLIEATIGMSFCQLLGQMIAFRKYIILKKPLRQALAFTFAKTYSFLLNTIKSFGFVFIAYLALLSVQFIIHENIVDAKPDWVRLAYGVLLIICFFLGFYRERRRTFAKNEKLTAKASLSKADPINSDDLESEMGPEFEASEDPS